MDTGKKFGLRFLFKLLLWGVVFGFVVGYLAEVGLEELGYPVIKPYFGAPLGITLGVVLAAVTYLASLRTIYDYITDLREKLANVGDLPFGIEEDKRLRDQASAFYELFDYEVAKLSEYRNKLERLSDLSKKSIEAADSRERAPLESYVQLLEEKFQHVNQLKQKVDRMESWIQDSVLPVVRVELEELDLENLDNFEEMIEFQSELQSRFRETTRAIESLREEVKPWREGADRLRDSIETANELLLDMSDTFQEFPDDTLVEQAEELRQHTRRWERLAERIESGYDSLQESFDGSLNSLQQVTDRANRATPPASVWKNVKEDLLDADNKVNQLKDLTQQHWVKNLEKQIDEFREQAEWLEDSLHQLRDEMKQEAETVDNLDKLAAELEEFVDSGGV